MNATSRPLLKHSRYSLAHLLRILFIMDRLSGNSAFNNSLADLNDLEEDLLSSTLPETQSLLEQFNITDIEKILNMSSRPVSVMTQCYCSGPMREVLVSYKSVHGYLSLIVCIFGTVANALNVAVLTRKDMASAPINRILTALAIADMLVMLEYIPYACYAYLVLPGELNMPYKWAVFVLFHSHFTQVLHTISIGLTLVLAIWRYIAIRFPQRSHILCSDKRCNMAIGIGYTLPLLVCIPSYFMFKIQATVVLENDQLIVLYHVGLSGVAKEDDELLFCINFWIYGIIIKLLPCAILTVISCWLIKALYKANRRKQALKGLNNCNSASLLSSEKRIVSKSERRTDRTTKMLVAVLMLFLITEFPQGILGLLSVALGRCFFRTCYYLFGEVMDILALLNGAINFILYCSMSRQFRTTFALLFKPRMLTKWSTPASQTDVQSTYV
ncbi:sex peptide receptor-like [Zootermopsis nevadensis]|uniref:sex peptide receptor-like n=1 Tax=Zootermopsis nevadensis TaxID=136037 RepID=UPI000B8E7F49|nr:sex peptide receptor-like [Zootermopsis nevadensis]